MADYYAILTQAGLDAIAAAVGGGPDVAFAQCAVGDANGAHYAPLPSQTALVNERWRGAVNRVYVHTQNHDWVIVEAMIPAAVGGWDIREVGLFTPGSPGTLLAVAKYPLTTKPAPGSGSEKDLYVRLVLQVTNGGEVVQEIDPTLVMATQEYVDAHAALTAPHQATPAATPDRLLLRDAAGRAQVAAPSAAADIARKAEVDAHAALTSPHSATSAATANRLVLRDAAGRAQVAAPSAAADIARKAEVDAHAELTSPHSATSAATPNRLVIRDAAGRAQVAAPSAAADIARKAEVDAHAITHTGNGLHGVWVGTVGPTGLFVQAPSGWAVARLAAGRYRVTHNRGNASYAVFVLPHSEFGFHVSASLADRTANSFEVWTHYGQENANPGFILRDNSFDFILVPKG